MKKKCKYLKDDLYCMIGKVEGESLSYAKCKTCSSFIEEEKVIKCHVCSHIFIVNEDVSQRDCPQCLNPINCVIHEVKYDPTPEQEFESFCKENDIEYDFDSKDGYYQSSETNKAFAVHKYSDFRGKM